MSGSTFVIPTGNLNPFVVTSPPRYVAEWQLDDSSSVTHAKGRIASYQKDVLVVKAPPDVSPAVRRSTAFRGRSEVKLVIRSTLTTEDLFNATFEVSIRNIFPNQSAALTWWTNESTFDLDNGIAATYVTIQEILEITGSAINRNIIDVKIISSLSPDEIPCLNYLHIVLQKMIIFVPGVCGSKIQVAHLPNKWTFPDLHISMTDQSDPTGWLQCDSNGYPPAGSEATRVDLFRSLDVSGYQIAQVYNVEAQDPVVNPPGHPRLILRGEQQHFRYYFVKPWPYDWRLRLETSVDQLLGKAQLRPTNHSHTGIRLPSISQVADEVRSSYPFLDDTCALAGHSTGGLIIRGVLADPSCRELVSQAFFIDVPFWGAPKAYYVFLTGEMLPFILLSAGLIRKLAPNLPIIYYLAPTEQYPDVVARLRDPSLNAFLQAVQFRETRRRDTLPSIFMKTLIEDGMRWSIYPRTGIPPWNVTLESAATQFHQSINTEPRIGWGNCTVFYSLREINATPGPVVIDGLLVNQAHYTSNAINGDDTVPLVSQRADFPAGRLVPIRSKPAHVPSPNEAEVWRKIIQSLNYPTQH